MSNETIDLMPSAIFPDRSRADLMPHGGRSPYGLVLGERAWELVPRDLPETVGRAWPTFNHARRAVVISYLRQQGLDIVLPNEVGRGPVKYPQTKPLRDTWCERFWSSDNELSELGLRAFDKDAKWDSWSPILHS